ncbi:hypothetical protein DL771_007288 [Monosporascus sp. 5C6A]|nr:hypothetical protein DL771_007288 [Monosporascus sp. 5C6A]
MEPVAITGFSFRLPQGAEDEASFWALLEDGRNVMTEWPESRANLDAFYHQQSTINNTLSSRGAHFVRGDPAAFDAPFFSITSKASMDPQQRWMLEATYRAVENAGIPVEKVAGTDTAVFAVSMADDYAKIIYKDPDEAPTNTSTGTSPSILANRLSWYFDLKGPSIQLNTACSSSLIATDLACQCLRSRQSSMALVAGSNVLLTPEGSLNLENMSFLSPDSRCYSFDHRANGYARGEGVAVLVLKRLCDAVRDGDMIRAVIRASGSNQDGHTPGITQPSLTSQEDLIRKVYKSCNLDFKSTRYVEAHGTGTQLGDSTEAKALGRVFRTARSPKEPLYIGSVKANIGHLEGASGLAGILKSIMILERGVIPPNALFERWNLKINAKFNNLQVPTSCIPWPTAGLRRISVNSFGFGGSNGHIIMDDAYHTLEALGVSALINRPAPLLRPVSIRDQQETNGATSGDKANEEPIDIEHVNRGVQNGELRHEDQSGILLREDGSKKEAENGSVNGIDTDRNNSFENGTSNIPQATSEDIALQASKASPKTRLLIWSAKDEAALKRMLHGYSKYCEEHATCPNSVIGPLAYTLSARRSLMSWRSFAVVSNQAPSDIIKLSPFKCVRSSREPGLAFVFTGQGAQYAKMGLDLLVYPVFHAVLSRASNVFHELGHPERIHSPQMSQPLCTVLQIALVELLREFGVVPDAVVGHSSGEIAAAYTIGALSLESACKIAYHRGRLAQQLAAPTPKPGSMMSVNIPEADVDAYLDKVSLSADISVACINSPFNVTLSGDEAAIDKIQKFLDKDEIFARKLKTGVAYHSPAMQQISEEYLSCIGSLEPRVLNASILMVSSVTGQKIPAAAMSQSGYWVDNLVSPVRFADALQYLALAAPKTDGLKTISSYIEIGPHGALKRPVRDTLSEVSRDKGFRYLSVLSKFDSHVKTALEVVGQLFVHGYPVSVTAANQQHTGVQQRPFIVDAPEYPFNHSQLHWHETRLSRDWRLREAVPRTLLGVSVADWNPLEPRWRKMLRIAEIPWLEDHIIGENVLFPATGSIIMALEAVRRMAHSHQTIAGYRIKEATFIKPIMVRAESDTEVITHLRPLQEAYEKAVLRFGVQLFTVVDGYWSECFKSTIHIEYEESPNEVDGGQEAHVAAQILARDYAHAKEKSVTQISKRDFYEWLRQQGLKYGDAFSLAEDICWDGDQLAVAHVNVEPPIEPYEGVVHPAVFDAACQVCYAAPSDGMSKELPTTIPYRIRDAWISATGWQYPRTRLIRVLTRSKLKPIGTGIECSIKAMSDDGLPLCHIEKFDMLPIMRNESSEDGTKMLLHRIDWKPQLSLLRLDQLRRYCDADRSVVDERSAVDYSRELDKTLRLVFRHNLGQLLETEWSKAPPHMEKYVSFMKSSLQKMQDEPSGVISEEALNGKLEELSAGRPSWRMFIEIAQNLLSIVCGDTDASELLLATSLAQDFYEDLFGRFLNHRLISYFQLAAHQTPALRILEVGAGSGAMTNLALSILERVEESTGGVAFCEYVYTDVSDSYLEKARERFAKHQSRMTFKALDFGQDITAQGFQPAGFDIILAGGVLHAIRNLPGMLQGLRPALKPGGHLLFCENAVPDCFAMNFGFGILPDWWRNEDDSRAWGPIMTEPEWDTVLRQNGFSGNDLVIRDYEDDAAHHASIIISTAPHLSQVAGEGARTLLVVREDDNYQKHVASSLVESTFNSPGHQPLIVPLTQWADKQVGPTDYVVFLADLGESLFAEISEPTFDLVKDLVQRSGYLLWVTSGDTSTDPGSSRHPYAGIKDGFLRTLRAEFNSKRIVCLSLEDMAQDTTHCVSEISRVFMSAFGNTSSELEYLVRGGQILTGRLVEDAHLNHELSASMRPETKSSPWLPGPPLKLDIGSRGQLDTLRFSEDADYYEDLGPTDVEIEAKAWAVNFRDVFSALGRLEYPGFGSDCAGIVTRVGPQCEFVRPGDRVCMCVIDCMRMYPRGDEWAVVKIPPSVSFEEACAVINPAVTAWHSLVELARLGQGERVLIHAASGATGQLAVQIAQMAGAEVFVTVGYDHKKQLLIDQYGIPADHIFYSRSNNTAFAKGIMRMTNGYGVDVVLNSLMGEGLRASWECIAPYGRFIQIGKTDINANSPLPMAHFANNATFTAVDIRHMVLHRKQLVKQLLHKTMAMAGDGSIHHPKPLHVYDVGAVEDAFRYVQSGKNSEPVVIRIDPSTEVRKHLITQRTWRFDEGASYLVAGGLGGIGRSILKWMASKGAKSLIVPSRSGLVSDAAAKVVSELREQNIRIITPKCDVASWDLLSQALEEWGKTMPPIRGCINAAMVLNDSVFENMSHTQWDRTIRSKVATSWNLHSLLADLDFMVLLSSVSGIVGNPGQSNYAAGCTFQDALARYRTHHGRKTTSIDLGVMRTIGVVAETESLQKHFDGGAQGLGQIEEHEFLALLDICCDPAADLTTPASQIVMGVGTPMDFLARSLEPPEIMQRPLFAHFRQAASSSHNNTTHSASDNFAALFRHAETAEERSSLVARSLARKLALALAIEPEDVDTERPLHAFGVDSLVAVELRNWIAKVFAAEVPVFEIVGGRTVKGVGELVERCSQIRKGL